MVWVVLTGMPAAAVTKSVAAAADFRAETAEGIQPDDFRAHRFHDPPSADQRSQAHRGMADEHDPEGNVDRILLFRDDLIDKSKSAMMPIVFWASFMPCPKLYSAAESNWPLRKSESTRAGRNWWKIAVMTKPTTKPSNTPMTGARTMKMATFVIPETMIALNPAFMMADPASPPISACEELVGNPKYQVMRFQRIAPNKPLSTTFVSTIFSDRRCLCRSVSPRGVLTTQAATKLNTAAQITACKRRQNPRGNDGGDRIRGIVDSVGEVERQGQNDHATTRTSDIIRRWPTAPRWYSV